MNRRLTTSTRISSLRLRRRESSGGTPLGAIDAQSRDVYVSARVHIARILLADGFVFARDGDPPRGGRAADITDTRRGPSLRCGQVGRDPDKALRRVDDCARVD